MLSLCHIQQVDSFFFLGGGKGEREREGRGGEGVSSVDAGYRPEKQSVYILLIVC